MVSRMQDLRIAMVVCRCPAGHPDHNLERVFYWTRRAAASGAHIVCFPELNISGYSLSPAAESAQALAGEVTRALQGLADDADITVLAGLLEKDSGGKLHVYRGEAAVSFESNYASDSNYEVEGTPPLAELIESMGDDEVPVAALEVEDVYEDWEGGMGADYCAVTFIPLSERQSEQVKKIIEKVRLSRERFIWEKP